MRKIVNQYDYCSPKGEQNSGELIVQQFGYVTAKQQIEALIGAGKRLQESRLGDYESDYYDVDKLDNVQNANSLDPVEVSEMQLRNEVNFTNGVTEAASETTETGSKASLHSEDVSSKVDNGKPPVKSE